MATETTFPARAKPIVPSDTDHLTEFDDETPVCMTVYVGTGGTVRCVPSGGSYSSPIDFVVPSGGIIPVQVGYVFSTGTDAADLVGILQNP